MSAKSSVRKKKILRPVRKSKRLIRVRKGWKQGRADGFNLGLDHGYYLGQCNAVIARVPEDQAGVFNLKILYVTTGKNFPYSPLDEAVIDGLSQVVREKRVVPPNANVAAIAAQFRPDLMLVLEGMGFPSEQVNAVRTLGIPAAIWFTDDPYYTDITPSIARNYDYVFTQDMGCIDFYKRFGNANVHHMPLAANPKVYRPQHVPLGYYKDVSFIGSAFWNRVRFIDQIAKPLAGKKLMISGWWWNRLSSYRRLASKIKLSNWMNSKETAKHYYGSKIVMNLHRSPVDDSFNSNRRRIQALSVNPRTFEIAACGAFQLTDVRSDLGSLYTPGVEIVTYQSPSDFVEKMNYYLRNEHKRREIALRGLRRTLLDHTYSKRLRKMFSILFPHLVPAAHTPFDWDSAIREQLHPVEEIPGYVFSGETGKGEKISDEDGDT